MEDYGTPISDLPKKIQELLAVWSDLEYKEKMWFLGLDDEETCSICQGNIAENSSHPTGNNAEPINQGRCCDECDPIVTKARINTEGWYDVLVE